MEGIPAGPGTTAFQGTGVASDVEAFLSELSLCP